MTEYCYGQQCNKALSASQVEYLAHRCQACYEVDRAPETHIETAIRLLGADKVSILLDAALYEVGDQPRVTSATAQAVLTEGVKTAKEWAALMQQGETANERTLRIAGA